MGIVAAIVGGAVLLVWCLFLAALVAPAEELEAAGVMIGNGVEEGFGIAPDSDLPDAPPVSGCLMPDACSCAEVAGPEQLAYVGPMLVCIVCQRVRTRPGYWVAGGSAPFGGVDAIRRAGKAEDCVCKWCAPMVMARGTEVGATAGAAA